MVVSQDADGEHTVPQQLPDRLILRDKNAQAWAISVDPGGHIVTELAGPDDEPNLSIGDTRSLLLVANNT